MADSPCLNCSVHELAADLGVGADKLAYIRSELSRIHEYSTIFRTVNTVGAPSDRISDLSRIANHARKLRQTLSGSDSTIDKRSITNLVAADPSMAILAFHLAEHFSPNRERHVSVADDVAIQAWWSDLMDKLEALEEVTNRSLSQLESNKKTGQGGTRHTADRARRETAWLLLRLYAEVTGKKPGVSNPPSGGEPTGPAVRFLTRCLVVFGWDVTPGAAAGLIRDIAKDDDPPWGDVAMAKSNLKKL